MTSLVALGLMAVPALAGQTHTPMQGTLGNPFNDGQGHGFGWNAAAGGGTGPLIGNLYDNILTINGGAATAGFFGPFADIPGAEAFVDWVGTQAQYGDDLHGISAGGPGPAVVTRLRYGYSNQVATTTHIIKLYDMLTPSKTHTGTILVTKGALLASVVVEGNPTGQFLVTVTNLNIQLPQSAVWIKFAESGPGFPQTFWLSGGAGGAPNPDGEVFGVGNSHNGITYTNKTDPPYPYNVWVVPYFFFTTVGYVSWNIQVSLSGFHVPAPAVMWLLGVAGLVTLRRRR